MQYYTKYGLQSKRPEKSPIVKKTRHYKENQKIKDYKKHEYRFLVNACDNN